MNRPSFALLEDEDDDDDKSRLESHAALAYGDSAICAIYSVFCLEIWISDLSSRRQTFLFPLRMSLCPLLFFGLLVLAVGSSSLVQLSGSLVGIAGLVYLLA